ncbi:hypothetical protein [Catellatospora sichuanensis]|uniref:hypothetical protein n=1 Tax=Catellatospora sichuanensis TaxID=1969805 RepID=UPI001181F744|nr:hypothetical protein [Catellatospora sichuanensis]
MDELLVQVQLMAASLWLTLKIFGPALLIVFGPRLWHRFRSKRPVQQLSTATEAAAPDRSGVSETA